MRRTIILLLGLSAFVLACAGGTGRVSRGGPEPLFRPAPVYPPEALRARRTGQVVVTVMVDEVGATRDLRVVAEEPPGQGFGEAAREAVAEWVWTPASMGGAPVEQSVRLAVRFDPDWTGTAPALPSLLNRSECPRPPGLALGVAAAAVFEVDVAPDGTPARVDLVRAIPQTAGVAEAARACVAGWRWREDRPGTTCVVVRFEAGSSSTGAATGSEMR